MTSCCRFPVVCFLLLTHSVAVSAENPLLVGAATEDIVSCLPSQWIGGAQVSVLEVGDKSESDMDQRAWAMRDAKWYFYSSDRETVLGAIYRERLIAQGVWAVDIEMTKDTATGRRSLPIRSKVPVTSLSGD